MLLIAVFCFQCSMKCVMLHLVRNMTLQIFNISVKYSKKHCNVSWCRKTDFHLWKASPDICYTMRSDAAAFAWQCKESDMQTHTVTHCTSLSPSGDEVSGNLRFIVTGHTTLNSALKQGLATALTLKLSLITSSTLILNQYQSSTLSFSLPFHQRLRLVHLYQHRCSIFVWLLHVSFGFRGSN